MFKTLIAAAELNTIASSGDVRIFDCRFNLADPESGYQAYCQGHIGGAVYVHLETDLSAPRTPGDGRHPLPGRDAMIETFARLGISGGDQVVAYDDAHGMIAARLWWMLRYLGHEAVAVLDGGLGAWTKCGLPLEAEAVTPEAGRFIGAPAVDRLAALAELDDGSELVDARDPVRYRGETEPLDPRAGHIPGARNHFFMNNLDSDGCFLSPEALRQAFKTTLGTLPSGGTVHYCGSGVSACHNILAQVHAGLGEPRLYCGSWSEWCADPRRPAAVGAEP